MAIGRVPPRFTERTLDGYIPSTDTASRALNAARRFTMGQIKSLVLVGPPGVGKSHLAAAIANAFDEPRLTEYREAEAAWKVQRAEWYATDVTEYRSPRPPNAPGIRPLAEWVSVPELLVGLRAEMGMDDEDRWVTPRTERLRESREPLILDDIGREKVSDWTAEVLYVLINARYEALLPTVATSNLGLDELQASGYWPAISRLAEDGELVRIEAPDFRLKKRAA